MKKQDASVEGVNPSKPTVESSMCFAGARIVRVQARRIAELLPGVLGGVDAEAIHDMRVATRKLRGALRVFRGALGGRKSLAPLSDELKWLADSLGAVRNEDVFLEWLEKYAKSAPKSHGATLVTLRSAREDVRDAAHLTLVRALRSARFGRIARCLIALAETESEKRAARRTVGECAPGRIERRWKEVRKARREFESYRSVAALHDLRIATKRLRYTAEFFGDAYGDTLDDLIADTIRVQDALGGVNDSHGHRRRIAAFGRKHPKKGHRAALDLATETCATQQASYTAQFEDAWKRLDAAPKGKRMDALRRRMERAE